MRYTINQINKGEDELILNYKENSYGRTGYNATLGGDGKKYLDENLIIQEYLDKGTITLTDYDISITYNEFANPSFENEIQILGSAYTNGQISTQKYVEILWGDKLSKEDKEKEIAYLEEQKKTDELGLGDFEDGTPIGEDRQEEEANIG